MLILQKEQPLQVLNFLKKQFLKKKLKMSTGFDFRAWMEAPVKTNKGKSKKAVKFPFLENCAALVDDDYWKNILKKCSQGKFPSYFNFNENTHILYFIKGVKKDFIYIPLNEYEAVHNFIGFFREKGNLVSPHEKIETTLNTVIFENNWKKVSASAKENLLYHYIRWLTEEMELTKLEISSLQSTLRYGIDYNIFNENTIIIVNNYIYQIKGLEYQNGRFYIPQDYLQNSVCLISSSSNSCTKYIVEYEKKSDPYLKWKKSLIRISKKQNPSLKVRVQKDYLTNNPALASCTISNGSYY